MRQPWIYSAVVDGVFILGTPFLITGAVFLFKDYFSPADSMTVVSWAILVMAVDVSHVYSTIYRTYVDRDTMARHGLFLLLLPFAVLVTCIALYAMGSMVFWRVMAYVAVFHFARQQYGFLRVYARHEAQATWQRRIDALAIYAATFYPVIDWHLAGQKNFNWFMKGDFAYFVRPDYRIAAFAIYAAILGLYIVKEASLLLNQKPGIPRFNFPRNAIMAGTLLSWYVGIVYFNSDLAFTAINVLSHGIPYIALVWIYGRKKHGGTSTGGILPVLFRPRYVALFVLTLLFFAYIEEGLWDAWVWHEKNHRPLFDAFHALIGGAGPDSPYLRLLVPLLSVPQITHYVIDGFIWKMRRDNYGWRETTLSS
ncbi:MAG: hypothetical protein U1F16_02740 [Turneriella sp.]